MGEHIKECCWFNNGPEAKPDHSDYEDQAGHGTHAIKWAHKDKRVHIISMSFGLGIAQNVETDRAIVAAKRDGITTFTAASNSGGNKPRAYPSNRGPPVICVYASDGLGNDGGISPDPLPDESNFSTLGISIASKWKGDEVLKSGTSFATPIAAALVTDVLEFARHKCDLDEFEFNSLRGYDGICKILKLMVRKRQGHDYLMPLHLWDGQNDDETIIQKLYKIAGRG
ncbi:peptidase S8/S53 domain-containing protein [Trichoderma compactum]